jgi:hypothetical protein
MNRLLLLLIFVAACLYKTEALTYTLPGLQSLTTLESSNPEIMSLSNIDNAAAGYCLQNNVTNFVKFYPQLNPTDPFLHCNGANKYRFETINMTLMARINLISLTTDGFDAFSADTNFAGQCRSQFPDYCYFVMWFFNVQAGFRCINNDRLPDNEAIQPPCKSLCNSLFSQSCPMFRSAIKQSGESDWMLCEYFSNSSCHTSGSSSWIPKIWMILFAVLPVILQFMS